MVCITKVLLQNIAALKKRASSEASTVEIIFNTLVFTKQPNTFSWTSGQSIPGQRTLQSYRVYYLELKYCPQIVKITPLV